MKKVLTILMCVTFTTLIYAQSPFVISPSSMGSSELMLLGESMSQNRKYVAGTDQMAGVPMIWNTTTDQVQLFAFVDSVWTDDWYWEVTPMTGSFHGINNAGIAVGSLSNAAYHTSPIMASATGNGEVTYLYEDSDDEGSEAYGISEDGSIIVGFHFDSAWTTHACIWTNNGTVRTDLPLPTDAQVGFAVEFASARWISADGSVILGYAQDDRNGAWVAITWTKQGDSYVVNPFCSQYYQTTYYDNEGNFVIPGQNPYVDFQPEALSANGEWVSITVLEMHDPTDWDNVPLPKVARYNLTSNQLQVLDFDESYDEFIMFGIANNGTCVGRLTGEFDWENWSQPVDAVIWQSNSNSCQKLSQLFPEDEYCASMTASAFSFITADASTAMGYASDENQEQSSFYVILNDAPVSIETAVAEISLIPNPATSKLVVNSNETIRSISIMDLKGQMVCNEVVNGNETTLNVQNIANGMYILNIVTDNGNITKKVAIAR